MQAALAAVPFETVSMDFIFALPGQTYENLRSDLEMAFSLGANHVAIYPFIDFTFTQSPGSGNAEKREARLAECHHPILLGPRLYAQLHLDVLK